MSAADSVGSLLADIANLIADAIRILTVSDKRHWGPDEHEHRRALDAVLDEARKDFQELSPLLNGQQNYELDRRRKSCSPCTFALLPQSTCSRDSRANRHGCDK
jgi:hypothetical protein